MRMQRDLTEREGLFGRAVREGARIGATLFAVASLTLAPASAQDVESFDPDEAYSAESGSGIDADLANPDLRTAPPLAPQTAPQPVPQVAPPLTEDAQAEDGFDNEFSIYEEGSAADAAGPEVAQPLPGEVPAGAEASSATYGQDDLIGAAEGVFGKGAQGLAGLIEDLLRDQGEPNGYIVGREAGGAFIFGARYGSGTLFHKIEGQRPVYWTGPSLGLDAGANAANTFVLVYNLYDSEDIYRRYPAGEGQAYFVGGLHASYMRRGDVVLIPIRMGAGLRLGVNAGYMRFSKKQRWLPF
jgi:hypothetical protein